MWLVWLWKVWTMSAEAWEITRLMVVCVVTGVVAWLVFDDES